MSLTKRDVDTLSCITSTLLSIHSILFFCKWVSQPTTLNGSIAPCYYESTLIVVGVIFPHRTHIVTFSFQNLKKKKNAAVSEGTFGCSRRSNGPTAVFRSKDWFYLFYHNTLFIHVKAVRNNILSTAMTCLTLPKQECKSLHLNEGSIHKRCYMCGQLSQTVDWSGAFSVLLAKGGTDWWQKWDQSHRGQG